LKHILMMTAFFKKLLLFLLTITVLSCSKPSAEIPEDTALLSGYAVPPSGILSLAIAGDGSFVELEVGAEAPEQLASPFPVALSLTAVQPLADAAILAVNRLGLFRLETLTVPASKEEGQPAIRLLVEPIMADASIFQNRTIGSSWAKADKAYFLLFRHPVYADRQPANPPSVLLMTEKNTKSISLLCQKEASASLGLWDNAYAVFPVSEDSWLTQYRSETADKVLTDYADIRLVDENTELFERKPLGRASFEKMAAAIAMETAPTELQEACKMLPGPLLADAALPDGSRKSYVRGDSGEAVPAWASIHSDSSVHGGIAAILATDDWRLVLVYDNNGSLETKMINLTAPVPGARVKSAAMSAQLVILLWEAGSFPYLSCSGLYAIMPHS